MKKINDKREEKESNNIINKEEKSNKKVTEKSEDKIKNNQQKNTKNAEQKRKGRFASKGLKIIWKIFTQILTCIVIFISIIIVVQKVTNNEESFLGFRVFRVQTGSMIPKYQIGDVILVKEVDPNKIQIGDDVTYQGEVGAMQGKLVTHRVIDIKEVNGQKSFQTQGIAIGTTKDPVIKAEQINGVVQTKMYILSLICMLLNNKYIFYFCGILPLTIYVAFRIFRRKK